MNTAEPYRNWVSPEVWQDPLMRLALAARDITTVYRLLQKLGVSHQRIAARTGQTQPKVSAIIHGRKVTAYEVLSKICEGLGVPRGYMDWHGAPANTTTPAHPAETDNPCHKTEWVRQLHSPTTDTMAAPIGRRQPSRVRSPCPPAPRAPRPLVPTA